MEKFAAIASFNASLTPEASRIILETFFIAANRSYRQENGINREHSGTTEQTVISRETTYSRNSGKQKA